MSKQQPTVGRHVNFWINGCDGVVNIDNGNMADVPVKSLEPGQPMLAQVTYVYPLIAESGNPRVNIRGADHTGRPFILNGVELITGDTHPPVNAPFVAWMDYQTKVNEFMSQASGQLGVSDPSGTDVSDDDAEPEQSDETSTSTSAHGSGSSETSGGTDGEGALGSGLNDVDPVADVTPMEDR